jgi:uncharacterized protein YndB with AHSA1/START domain
MDSLQASGTVVDRGSAQDMLVRLERRIAAEPARVWSVISSVEGMREWLGPKNFEPRLEGRVLFDVSHGTDDSGRPNRWIMFGKLTRFEPERGLAFTWQELDANSLRLWPVPTTVAVELEALDGGTLVTLTHSGFEALPDGAEQYAGYAKGWMSLNDLDSLARMCESGQ